MAKEYKDLVVGLDIGTAKVMVVVAEVMPGGELKLAGLGVAPSNGLKRGVVVNIDATVQSIQQALREAELMADCKITRVYTGITGSHIRGINSSGMVAIKDREVTAADVARVVETAKAINISTDQRLLLVEPQEFIIDGQDVKEPIGMSGIRLEAKVHIVTGAQSAAENIIKCVRRCGLEVEQLMLNPLASSQSVLTEDERELGVALVDIGAGTTDLAIFTNGAIRHTAVIPIAGDLITSDIAMALRTPTKDAEEIKVENGYAKQLLADPEAQVEVPGLGDRGPRMLSRQALAGVIEPRVEEIFSLVHQVMRESGFEEMLSSGIVLTGGSCIMPGMVELGEDIFFETGTPGHPQVHRRLVRYGGAAARRHRDGPARRGPHGTSARLQGGTKKWLHENCLWQHQGLDRGELLTMPPSLWLHRASPPRRWRPQPFTLLSVHPFCTSHDFFYPTIETPGEHHGH
jgi:cell division protein FtsA